MEQLLARVTEWAKDPDHLLALAAFLVSAAAFLVSAFVAAVNWRLQRRLIALQETEASSRETASRRALLKMEKQSTGRPGMGRLVLKNDGYSTARNVKVELDGKTPLDHGSVFDGPSEIPAIGPGAD